MGRGRKDWKPIPRGQKRDCGVGGVVRIAVGQRLFLNNRKGRALLAPPYLGLPCSFKSSPWTRKEKSHGGIGGKELSGVLSQKTRRATGLLLHRISTPVHAHFQPFLVTNTRFP